ncbi:uncharacterized protein BCR38DRAFT_412191 [Pseudomassariella vexata]|uniref:Chitinase n=1 Tax=Pseudomassariella vexata TaxID=1141098 RepID=A0A1Y2DL28_9PEZI|nr:uncharacterized protein BCR38DRAFT_412191 [Pseudomassariella vexata]ORY59980.1 hypothetical protein BCR38DRAFT_412191 [Pseudomassariella vexata]
MHFDLDNIRPNFDWFNIVAYDQHGAWDAQSQSIGPFIVSHTDLWITPGLGHGPVRSRRRQRPRIGQKRHDGQEDANQISQKYNGGIYSYYYNEFNSMPTKEELEKKAEELADEAALNITFKAFCRTIVLVLLPPMEFIKAIIPIIGESLDIAGLGSTPALIQLGTEGIEKEVHKSTMIETNRGIDTDWEEATLPVKSPPEALVASPSPEMMGNSEEKKAAPSLL